MVVNERLSQQWLFLFILNLYFYKINQKGEVSMEYLIGLVAGCIISNIIFFIRYKFAGTLRIDHSNPEKDVYRFEIDKIDKLSKRHRIILKIDNNADLSQK